ncbi:TPA: hypothetical protein DEP30_02205 [Candidatus Nomurabacteria bacterium]|nr:hypothetical protein [Candidatus Nomurabacteria bacterium]HAS70129.1 hypothetical protein [Candidatus Nomurabacteria bacterium]HBI35078.1 hypothetical protein [Candidatus Nomurabacteria bacterium]HBU67031.1 hypothetical protein [Candidatus Nomurabacteria bacterium]HCB21811.1 hypothetical protein [Candidatus Nomurabacteria bacterium]
MSKQKIIRYLQSIVAIPMLAVAMPLSGIQGITDTTPSIANKVEVTDSAITTQEKADFKKKADAIDTFLTSRGSVLAGYGAKFVEEADKNNIDWRLLIAIAGRETTFGRNMCKNPKAQNNPFGWGSCKIGFKSIDESIEKVSASLGGNSEGTAHHYTNKTTLQILRKYNSVIPNYPKEVERIMKMIDASDPIK